MNIAYAMLGIDGVMYMLDMQCCVDIVLYAWWICNVVFIWCCVHVGYEMLCTYCTVRIMDVRCCVHMVLCTCWICSVVYR